MPDVITLGETMVLINPVDEGPLRYVERFKKQIAGAETNVAIGLTKLGHTAGWISRLGDDEFGHYILSFVRGEGVDTSRVVIDPRHQTGVFFRERKKVGTSQVYYYRRNSAASYLSPVDLDKEYIASAKYLHLTGITPALSESCLQTVEEAISLAHEAGTKVSFDPNLRLKLWNRDQAREILLRIISQVDILLPGLEEAGFLLGESLTVEEYAQEFLKMGPEIMVMKLGKTGSYVADRDGGEKIKGFPLTAVDPVGAGDAFAAGFLAGLLEEKDIFSAARQANAAGAFAVTLPGDIEALPDRKDINDFIIGRADVIR